MSHSLLYSEHFSGAGGRRETRSGVARPRDLHSAPPSVRKRGTGTTRKTDVAPGPTASEATAERSRNDGAR